MRPTFINMSQEDVDMRDAYLGKRRLWEEKGRDELPEDRRSLDAEVWAPQVTPQHWPFGRESTA